MKNPKNRLHSVMVVGATPAGVAAANKLGELGVPVTLVDGEADLDRKLGTETYRLESGVPFNFAHRPGLIRILRNPGIRLILPAAIRSTKHNQQGFCVQLDTQQTFVDKERCTLCGQCAVVCPLANNKPAPIQINSRLSLPGSAFIDKRREPLCQAGCPLGVNVQGYMALAAAGRYQEALDLIRQDNVLPAICGRICTHPCENACRRGEVDSPLAIRDIKRFIADRGEAVGTTPSIDKLAPAGDPVAVIGAGPAGLAAAAELVRQGFQVTLFEKEKAAGGLLRYGIGPHRLPREILEREVKHLQDQGMRMVTDSPVEMPAGPAKLLKDYKAVLLTTGSWADRPLGVPGEALQGVDGCVSFLARVYRGQVRSLKGKAAVIGDGNAAFDLARTLNRLGAEVTIISWFSRGEIPAEHHEISAATQEGIGIKDRCQVVGFTGNSGRLQQIQVMPTRPGPTDANGIAWPQVIPQSDSTSLAFDHAFVAIGQMGAYKADGSRGHIGVSERGYLMADEAGRTGLAGVYAAGDAVSGASSVVQAMAAGRKAAVRIIADLTKGKQIRAGVKPLLVRPAERDFLPLPAQLPHQERPAMPEKPVAERKNNFNEVALGYNDAQVRQETARCMQCGGCAQCLACLDACGTNQALRHDEPSRHITENVGVLIIADPDMAPGIRGDDVIRAYGPASAKPDVHAMMLRGFAAAAKAMVLLKETAVRLKGHGVAFVRPDPALDKQIRMGVFACRCNDSFGWLPGMDDYMRGLSVRSDIKHAEVLTSACVPEGITRMLGAVREKGLTRVVLASCVCCPLNYVCSSCTDQRSRLKDALFSGTGLSRSMVQTCNLRGEVLRLTEKQPRRALDLFTGLMERSIGRAAKLLPFPAPVRTYNFTTAVIGQTEAAVNSAMTLAQAGLEVLMFGTAKHRLGAVPAHPNIFGFEGSAATSVSGTLGNFQVTVQLHDGERAFAVGGVIIGEKSRNIALYSRHHNLPDQVVQANRQKRGELGIPFMYPCTTSISGLFLADPPGVQISKQIKGAAAAVLAAAVMPRGPRQNRGFSVVIKEALCRGCGRCLGVCPYTAVSLKALDNGGYTAVVDEVLCKGCGNCISVCPSNAADSPFRDQGYLEQTLEELLTVR